MISNLLHKLADATEKLEKIDFEKIGSEFSKSANMKFENRSSNFGCDGVSFSQKNIIFSTDNLDVKFDGSSEKFSVALYLAENVNVDLVSVSFDKSEEEKLKITAHCHQNNGQGFLLIKGFSGNSLKIVSKNGDVHIMNTCIPSVNVETENGDIEMDSVQFSDTVLKSDNGDIDVSVEQECRIDIESKYGDVDKTGIESNFKSDKTLKCTSKNGDISVRKV